jgi:hypothetical protein
MAWFMLGVLVPYGVWLAWELRCMGNMLARELLPAGSVPIGGSTKIWYNRRIKKNGVGGCAKKYFSKISHKFSHWLFPIPHIS